jgi:hypothetical protein
VAPDASASVLWAGIIVYIPFENVILTCTSTQLATPAPTPKIDATSPPTRNPSSKPTSIPTSKPTSIPTSKPTSIPTSKPTLAKRRLESASALLGRVSPGMGAPYMSLDAGALSGNPSATMGIGNSLSFTCRYRTNHLCWPFLVKT